MSMRRKKGIVSPATGNPKALSLGDLADLLDITERELCSLLRLQPSLMRRRPDDQRLQRQLCVLAEVRSLLLELKPDPAAVAFHLKNTPIPLLGHRTLMESVRDGDARKALRYLQSISGGQNG
ncbi:hypothetical protein [Lysobacter sp. 22409]|uniref:hypothetical protein n=1 Tax=Lysobacter sp. 22409 TaxID=3453917 RepID=UPI003F87AF8D